MGEGGKVVESATAVKLMLSSSMIRLRRISQPD